MKKKIGIGILVIGALLILLKILGPKPAPDNTQYVVVQRGAIVNAVYGIGTLVADRSLQIKSGITTSVQQFYVKEGEVVKKGQRLLRLEGVGDFRAPFPGVVTNLYPKEGETIFAQTSIMTLTDLTSLYLSVAVEQEGALKVKPGLAVKISFDGMRDRNFDGVVDVVYSSGIDFLAKISVQNLPKEILPGMSADAAIILSVKKDALLIPVAALEGAQARVRRNKNMILVPVQIGLIDGDTAEIIGGEVREGDVAVILKGKKP